MRKTLAVQPVGCLHGGLATPNSHHHHRRYSSRWTDEDARALADLLGQSCSAGCELLDLGGGDGRLAALLASATGCHATVVDQDSDAVGIAGSLEGVSAVCADAGALPFADGSFDAVILFDALHHMPDRANVPREVARVLRPGGTVVVGELDPGSVRVQLIGLSEKLVGEQPAFLERDECASLFAAADVEGRCQDAGPGSYVFRGVKVGR